MRKQAKRCRRGRCRGRRLESVGAVPRGNNQIAGSSRVFHIPAVMSDRQIVLETIQRMPEAASMTEIMDELRLVASVRVGLEESERGEGVPHERVAELLEGWITKSSGRHAA